MKSLNQWFYQNAVEINADFIVVCVPGGIIQSTKYNRYCDYGLLDYLLVKAIKPDYVLCSVFHDINAVENIPNVFAPYKINAFIRINKILDQNIYDFSFQNRSMIINKQNVHITESVEYDINDSNYFIDIAQILYAFREEENV